MRGQQSRNHILSYFEDLEDLFMFIVAGFIQVSSVLYE